MPDRVDHTAVGAAISTISSNLPEMTRGVKTVAALMDDGRRGDDLMGAARRLCGAFSDMLTAVSPARTDTVIESDELSSKFLVLITFVKLFLIFFNFCEFRIKN